MNATTLSPGNARLLKGVLLPGLVAVISLGVAVVGAFLVRGATGIDGVNGFVESLAETEVRLVCRRPGGPGAAGLRLRSRTRGGVQPVRVRHAPSLHGPLHGDRRRGGDAPGYADLGRALLVGGAVTAGFVVLFGIAGVVIGIGARSVVGDVLPWLGLAIGVLLAVVGAWVIGGGKLYTAIAQQAAARIGDPRPEQRSRLLPVRRQLRGRLAELHAPHIPGGGRHDLRRVKHPHLTGPVRPVRTGHGPRDRRADTLGWPCSGARW